MNFRDFAGDALLEQKGVWCPFEDAKFLIAANMNPTHRKLLGRLGKKNQRAIRLEDEAAQDALTIEAMATAIVIGWEGVTNGTEPFPYTVPNAITLLTQSRVLREFVAMESQRLGNFQKEKEEGAQAELKSGAQVVPPVGGELGIPPGA